MASSHPRRPPNGCQWDSLEALNLHLSGASLPGMAWPFCWHVSGAATAPAANGGTGSYSATFLLGMLGLQGRAVYLHWGQQYLAALLIASCLLRYVHPDCPCAEHALAADVTPSQQQLFDIKLTMPASRVMSMPSTLCRPDGQIEHSQRAPSPIA